MNTSVTMTAATDPTPVTVGDESGSFDSLPVPPMNNDDLSLVDSQSDTLSTATTKTGHTLIATMLFFHLSYSLLG